MYSPTFYNIKAEKANAILKYRRLRKIANLVRFIEICLVLILISRFPTQLPIAVKNSGDYFRCLSDALISPRFVFFLGNVIVITLFAKSGQFSPQDSGRSNSRSDDLYEEFIQISEKNRKIRSAEVEDRTNQTAWVENLDPENLKSFEGKKSFQRSQSENLAIAQIKKPGRELRRSETEKIRKSSNSGEKLAKSSYPEDNMSNEEFRRTVEDFIARQQRFRREEEYTVF